jgi:hypothetical protein
MHGLSAPSNGPGLESGLGFGGAISVRLNERPSSINLSVRSSSLTNCSASHGGGIYFRGRNVVLERVEEVGCSAYFCGSFASLVIVNAQGSATVNLRMAIRGNCTSSSLNITGEANQRRPVSICALNSSLNFAPECGSGRLVGDYNSISISFCVLDQTSTEMLSISERLISAAVFGASVFSTTAPREASFTPTTIARSMTAPF